MLKDFIKPQKGKKKKKSQDFQVGKHPKKPNFTFYRETDTGEGWEICQGHPERQEKKIKNIC